MAENQVATSTATPAQPNQTNAVPPVNAAETKATERMYKVKVNDQEEMWPESKIVERAQKSAGAEVAMKKAAEYEKAFGAFISQAQDPSQLIALLNSPVIKYDEDKHAALVRSVLSSKNPKVIETVKRWIYENEIEPSMLDPKDLELRELKKFKDSQLEMQKKAEEQARLKEEQEKTVAAWERLRIGFGQELKAQGLPERESNVARVARYAMLYRRAGKEIDVVDCVKRVKADLVEEYKLLHAQANEDNILDHFDEELARKINAAFVKKIQGKPQDKIESNPTQRKTKTKEMSREDKKAWLRKLERGQI